MPDTRRPFGVELELSEPYSQAQGITRLLRTLDLEHPVVNREGYCRSRGAYWEIKTDSSCGLEIASPALNLHSWYDVAKVCTALRPYRVNESCGVHVHHAARDLSTANRRKLVFWWGVLEPVFLELVAPHRRTNRFCAAYRWTWNDMVYIARHPQLAHSHHVSLSLAPLRRLGTLEFRLLEGTLDGERIYNWVVLTQSVVNLARRGIHLSTLQRLTSAPLGDRFQVFQHYATQPYSRDKADPIHKVFADTLLHFKRTTPCVESSASSSREGSTPPRIVLSNGWRIR